MRNRNSVKVRRDHKDTLFRMIFSTRENLLSLYNAVNHSHYTDAKELEIVTLENAVYMNMKNDQAFLLDMQLNLYEHQSTWNPNMPLRFLIYVTKEYQMLIRNQTLYASTLVELPTPHFVVFYNGEEIGKSVGELDIRRKYGINILGIKHSGKIDASITPDTVLSGEITILALGEYKALQKCFRI